MEGNDRPAEPVNNVVKANCNLSFLVVFGDLVRQGYGRYRLTHDYTTPDGKINVRAGEEIGVSHLSLGYVAFGKWGSREHTYITVQELSNIQI